MMIFVFPYIRVGVIRWPNHFLYVYPFFKNFLIFTFWIFARGLAFFPFTGFPIYWFSLFLIFPFTVFPLYWFSLFYLFYWLYWYILISAYIPPYPAISPYLAISGHSRHSSPQVAASGTHVAPASSGRGQRGLARAAVAAGSGGGGLIK